MTNVFDSGDWDQVRAWRHDLHREPELAYAEERTSQYVADRLASFGLEVHRGIAKTGVVGTLRSRGSGSQHAIALRADMDALPIEERNTFEHRSRRSKVMHACGHDGHMAMLLGAARELARRSFAGTIHFVFQPAEEGGGGGAAMISEGLFDRFPADAVFGMHNWPGLPLGQFAIRPGAMMAGSDTFEIAIKGRGCHGAMPDMGIDPIQVGAEIVGAAQTIVSRKLSPATAAVVSITQFHAGDAWAVIPEEATLRGTARSFDEVTSGLIERTLNDLCAGIARAHGAQAKVVYKRGYPPTINSETETAMCRSVAEALVGTDNVRRDLPPSMGAEDFAFMLKEKPGAYIWLGNGPTEGSCLLHNPHYDFNDDALRYGVAYWVSLVERFFESG